MKKYTYQILVLALFFISGFASGQKSSSNSTTNFSSGMKADTIQDSLGYRESTPHPIETFSFESKADTTKDTLIYLGTFNYGLTGAFGKVIGTSYLVPSGTNHYKNGGNGGLFFVYPLSKKLYIYLSMGVAERGYTISSSLQNDNSIYYRKDVTEGYRNLLYLDKIKCLGYNFSQSFSIYVGGATSIKIREKSYFQAISYLTPKDPSTHKANTIKYPPYSKTGNDALDFLDVAFVAGLRWNVFNTFGVSGRFMRDVIGLNTSTKYFFKNTLVNSGFYVVVDIPLYKNKLYNKK